MNNQNTGEHACYCPYNTDLEDDEEDWNAPSVIEYQKESYIKHIRQDVGQFKTFCTAKEMAQTIGGAFTEDFMLEICRDTEWKVTTFKRKDKTYIAIEPFLEKLKSGLTFEDSPTDSQ